MSRSGPRLRSNPGTRIYPVLNSINVDTSVDSPRTVPRVISDPGSLCSLDHDTYWLGHWWGQKGVINKGQQFYWSGKPHLNMVCVIKWLISHELDIIFKISQNTIVENHLNL